MKTLWFKSCYAPDILAGRKIDTIRKMSNRLPRVGETVAFTVGPRPPFARATITNVEHVSELPEWRKKQVVDIYGEIPADAVRLVFQLTDEFEAGG
jgi:hypothetical protein